MSSAGKIARKVFVGGNWKSNGSLKFVNEHVKFLNNIQYSTEKAEVVVAPMNIHLQLVNNTLSNGIQAAAQNVSSRKEGAFTGEVAATHLNDLGVKNVIIGHSERRSLFHETDDVVTSKIKISHEHQLRVIACLGETLEERQSNKTMDVLYRQIEAITKGVANWRNTVLAYEPVWAIGTGLTASPEQAQEVHKQLRAWLNKNVSKDVSDLVQIIYGGSVTDENAKDLIQQADIDGFLVGGASLKKGFEKIVQSSNFKV